MTKSKPVRGLLDYISLKPDEKPEWEPISESYVPGMGLGASKDAIRWAYKGYLVERYQQQEKVIAQIKAQMKQNTKIGPPEKTPELRVDNLRAYYLWFLVRDWAESFRCELTSRRAIELAKMQPVTGKTKAIWGHQESPSIEQSVSRGKSFWRIDNSWNSERCEQFHAKYL